MSVFSTIHEFLESRDFIFLSGNGRYESKDRGHSCVPLNPPSPAQPCYTADFQGLRTASPLAQHGLCSSKDSLWLISMLAPLRRGFPDLYPKNPLLLLLTLTSPSYHPFDLFVACVIIWHCLIGSPVSGLLSFPLRPETTGGQGAYQFYTLLYLQHLEKHLVHKYVLNASICELTKGLGSSNPNTISL